MSKGTILYLGGFELPDKNAAAHRVLSNGKIFRELGYNVVFIDVDRSLNNNSKILKTFKKIQDFSCYSVPYPNTKLEWLKHLTSVDFINIINEKYKDIKIIVAYNYPAVALSSLKKYGTKNNIKIVADCTEWYSTENRNLLYKIAKGLDTFFRMRVIHKQLDGLIVISRYLENYYKYSENVIFIPPLVDINEDKWATVDYSMKYLNKKKKMTLVYSGSPGKDKDKINYIIDALYKLKDFDDFQLKIVGINKNQFLINYPYYDYKIKELGNRILFLGRLSHKDSLNILKSADYSIFIREKSKLTMAGFPTKFVESVSCGVPVITSDTSDLKEFFTEPSSGFLLSDASDNELYLLLRKVILNGYYNNDILSKGNKMFHYENYKNIMDKFLVNFIA